MACGFVKQAQSGPSDGNLRASDGPGASSEGGDGGGVASDGLGEVSAGSLSLGPSSSEGAAAEV
jgi:hypothetical protein